MPKPLKKIFFIDDQEQMQLLAKAAFKKLPDVEVFYFTSGQAALSAIALNPPDLIVSDLQMPEVTGRDILAAVSVMPSTMRPRVFILSGETDPKEIESLLKSGAALVLDKSSGFLATIKNIPILWDSLPTL